MSSASKMIGAIFVLIFIISISYIDIFQPTEFDNNTNSINTSIIKSPTNSTCFSCHINLSNILDNRISQPAEQWRRSIHYNSEVVVMCRSCHGGNSTTFVISDAKSNSSNYIRNLSRQNSIEMCENCHKVEYNEFKSSSHWLIDNTTRRLTCVDCHTAHDIQSEAESDSPIARKNIAPTCGQCHETEYNNYYQTFHGKFFRLGSTVAATCTDCHSSHGALPKEDPNSTTHSDNLARTCALCHDNSLDIKVERGLFHDNVDTHTSNLMLNKSGLDSTERSYFIGPFDLAYYIPFVYGIMIVVFVFTLISLILLEVIFSKFFRRDLSE